MDLVIPASYFTDVRWLKSATITLLSDNKTVSVLCDLNESSPPVKCSVIVNCTTHKSVTTEVFDTGSTTVRITPGNDCCITVQAVSTDTEKPLEDYSITKTLSFPRSSHGQCSGKLMIFMSVSWKYISSIYMLQFSQQLGAVLSETQYLLDML